MGIAVALGAVIAFVQAPPKRYMLSLERKGYEVTPAGVALCVALGIKPGEPCNADVILEASQSSTVKSLWIEKTVSSLENPPSGFCLEPIVVETYPRGGFIHVCHEPDEDDTISEADMQRVGELAMQLNADTSKSLARHQWSMRLKVVWKNGLE